jgi:hypothetical protein
MNTITTAGPIRMHTEANGDVHVVADLPTPQFRGAFRVLKAGTNAVRVTLGSVEGRIPYIGSEPLHAARLPMLKLDEGPNDDLLSWVALKVAIEPTTGLMNPDQDDAAQVVHISDHALLSENGLAPDVNGSGYHSLALLVWRSRTSVQHIVQDTWFNQRHSFRPGTGTAKGYHFFRPIL